MTLRNKDYTEALRRFTQKIKVFAFSKDVLVFCFFVLLAFGIWYIHALQKQESPSPSSSEPTATSNNYTEKVIVLPIKARGKIPAGSEIVLFPAEVKITAQVDMEHYNDLLPEDFSAVCTYSHNADGRLPIEVSCTKPYVTSFRLQPQVAEYIIQKQ